MLARSVSVLPGRIGTANPMAGMTGSLLSRFRRACRWARVTRASLAASFDSPSLGMHTEYAEKGVVDGGARGAVGPAGPGRDPRLPAEIRLRGGDGRDLGAQRRPGLRHARSPGARRARDV